MTDLQVIEVDQTTRVVRFVVQPRKLSGISKLIQIVVLSLMNVPDQDVLDPGKGGGFPEMIGMNINPKDSTDLFAEVARRIKKSESEILDDQIGLDDPPDEKLRELQIINISEGNAIDEVFIKIRVINQEGQTSDLVV